MSDFDWTRAPIIISRSLTRVLRQFAQRHPHDDHAKVLLVADSRAATLALAVDRAKGGSAGWDAREFSHPRFAELSAHPEWEPLGAAVRAGDDEERQLFLDAACIALLLIRSNGAIDEVRPTREIAMLVRDGDEPEADAVARMARVTALVETADDESADDGND